MKWSAKCNALSSISPTVLFSSLRKNLIYPTDSCSLYEEALRMSTCYCKISFACAVKLGCPYGLQMVHVQLGNNGDLFFLR